MGVEEVIESGRTRSTNAHAPGWGEQDSNLRRQSHGVYSATPLTARESPRRGGDHSRSRATADGASSSDTSNGAYFGPPTTTVLRPSTACAGMSHLRPSATSTKTKSHRAGSNSFTTRFQLWLPPPVARNTQ